MIHNLYERHSKHLEEQINVTIQHYVTPQNIINIFDYRFHADTSKSVKNHDKDYKIYIPKINLKMERTSKIYACIHNGMPYSSYYGHAYTFTDNDRTDCYMPAKNVGLKLSYKVYDKIMNIYGTTLEDTIGNTFKYTVDTSMKGLLIACGIQCILRFQWVYNEYTDKFENKNPVFDFGDLHNRMM